MTDEPVTVHHYRNGSFEPIPDPFRWDEGEDVKTALTRAGWATSLSVGGVTTWGRADSCAGRYIVVTEDQGCVLSVTLVESFADLLGLRRRSAGKA